ncbi:MAG: hypothetical protein HY842_06125 [Bacteroidetes bacterium]|nr:hypothetical protein [Bacteroidota bacterium]
MKEFLTLFTFLTFTTAFANTSCDKCDIDKVKIVIDHLDSLTFQIVDDFLCTFDSSCNTNLEYSEWSNETLFKVLDKAPAIFFQVIAKRQVDNKILFTEIENPVHDGFDLQEIYDKILATSVPTDLKTKFLDALITAAGKNGQKIKK